MKAPAVLLLAALTLYGALVLVESVRIAGRTKWASLRFAPTIFLAIHGGLGFGYLIESVKGLVGR